MCHTNCYSDRCCRICSLCGKVCTILCLAACYIEVACVMACDDDTGNVISLSTEICLYEGAPIEKAECSYSSLVFNLPEIILTEFSVFLQGSYFLRTRSLLWPATSARVHHTSSVYMARYHGAEHVMPSWRNGSVWTSRCRHDKRIKRKMEGCLWDSLCSS